MYIRRKVFSCAPTWSDMADYVEERAFSEGYMQRMFDEDSGKAAGAALLGAGAIGAGAAAGYGYLNKRSLMDAARTEGRRVAEERLKDGDFDKKIKDYQNFLKDEAEKVNKTNKAAWKNSAEFKALEAKYKGQKDVSKFFEEGKSAWLKKNADTIAKIDAKRAEGINKKIQGLQAGRNKALDSITASELKKHSKEIGEKSAAAWKKAGLYGGIPAALALGGGAYLYNRSRD